jgi:hypothetical protein
MHPYKSDSVMSITVSRDSKPSSMNASRYCSIPNRVKVCANSVIHLLEVELDVEKSRTLQGKSDRDMTSVLAMMSESLSTLEPASDI